jgi:hypothetical protein
LCVAEKDKWGGVGVGVGVGSTCVTLAAPFPPSPSPTHPPPLQPAPSSFRPMQLLSMRQTLVRQQDVVSAWVGQKDMTQGAFAIWQDLVQRKVRAWVGVVWCGGRGEGGRGGGGVCAGIGERTLTLSLPSARRSK